MKSLLTILMLTCIYKDAIAQIQWQKCLGGSSFDNVSDIHQTFDGGYIVAGTTCSIDGDITESKGTYDFWIVKLSPLGNIEWQKNYGGSNYEFIYDIHQTSDTGFIVAGLADSFDGDVFGKHGPGSAGDYWVLKLSSTGALQWQKCLGGTKSDVAHSIQQTKDGGYIVAGSSNSIDGDVIGWHGKDDALVVKLSPSGEIEWAKAYGGANDDRATSICESYLGGYTFVAQSFSVDGDITSHHGDTLQPDFWVVKLSSSGGIEWEKSVGGNSGDCPNYVAQTADSGYIVTGYSFSGDGDVTGGHIGSGPNGQNIWVVKLTADGSIMWNKCIYEQGQDDARSIQQTIDNGYIVAGRTSQYVKTKSDVLMVKLSEFGNVEWRKRFGGNDVDFADAVEQTADGGYILGASTRSNESDVFGNHGESDCWIVKLGTKTDVLDNIITSATISITPNPSKRDIIITAISIVKKVAICNILGQVVYSQECNDETVHVCIADLPAGVYIAKINEYIIGRFVKE